jgi:hypothetical protein
MEKNPLLREWRQLVIGHVNVLSLPERLDSMVDLGTAELLRSTLRELSDYLHLSTTKWDEEEEEEEQKADWRFMAMSVPNPPTTPRMPFQQCQFHHASRSLDRACLFLYAFICCALPLWIFAATPTSTVPSGLAQAVVDRNALC